MTILVANTANTNTFEYWVTRTNELADAMSTKVVTALSNTTVGNVTVDGIFAAQTFVANTALRGGNTTTSGVLTISSNLTISTGNTITVGNSTVNVVANSSTIVVGNSYISTTLIYAGNSTVNAQINSTAVVIGSASVNTTVASIPTSVIVGNSTVNAVVNSTSLSISNSTVVYNFIPPTSAQKAADTYYLNANGSWLEIPTVEPVTYTTTGTSAQEVDSWLLATYYSTEYNITVNDNNANNRQISKMVVIHDEGDAYYNEYAIVQSNSAMGTFVANSNTTHCRLFFTPVSSNTTLVIQSSPTSK